MAVSLSLDPARCDGFGYCAELLAELISLDEWGFPIIERREVPAVLEAACLRAVRSCSRRALTLRTSTPVALRAR